MFTFPLSHWALSIYENKYSMLLDGSDEVFELDGVVTPLASTTAGTWSVWVKPVDATPTTQSTIMSFGDTDVSEGIHLFILTNGKLRAHGQDAGANVWVLDTDAAAFSDDTWTHVVLTHNGTEAKILIDNVEVAQTFVIGGTKAAWFSAMSGIDNYRIGALDNGGSGKTLFFNGNVDEVGIWSSELTTDEKTAIHNSGVPTDLREDAGDYASSDDLVAWHRMGELASFSTEWSIPDASVNSNAGTSVNVEEVDRKEDTPS